MGIGRRTDVLEGECLGNIKTLMRIFERFPSGYTNNGKAVGCTILMKV